MNLTKHHPKWDSWIAVEARRPIDIDRELRLKGNHLITSFTNEKITDWQRTPGQVSHDGCDWIEEWATSCACCHHQTPHSRRHDCLDSWCWQCWGVGQHYQCEWPCFRVPVFDEAFKFWRSKLDTNLELETLLLAPYLTLREQEVEQRNHHGKIGWKTSENISMVFQWNCPEVKTWRPNKWEFCGGR